jgi:pimeloyl-ACP methyl ester carboxylesterase
MEEPPALDGVRHEFVDAGGLRTHVALAGPRDGPPLVLVHGWPQNWWVWRAVIPALAGSFRVIAPDLRGHGWTEAPSSGYDKEQLASDLLATLDALGVERASWIGHDWGGWTGLLAALRAPERFDRVLAVCIPHLWFKATPRQLAMLLGYQVPISLPLLGRRAARSMVPKLLQFGRGADRLDPTDIRLFSERIPPRVTVAMYRTLLTREALPLLRGRYDNAVLRVPTTLLLGERDPVTANMRSGAVPGQPELRVELVEGVGHWVPEQRPQRIVDWADAGSH